MHPETREVWTCWDCDHWWITEQPATCRYCGGEVTAGVLTTTAPSPKDTTDAS